MKNIVLIVSVVVHWLVAFVLMYSSDTADVETYKDGKLINVLKPSIHNLRFLKSLYLTEDVYKFDTYELEKYIEKVINPSYHYFILREDIKGDDECSNMLTAGVLQIFSFIIIVRNAIIAFPNQGLPKTLYLIIVIATSLVACSLGCFIVWKLYEKYLALSKFNFNKEDLEERFYYDESEYDISEEDALNNFIIKYHYSYLCAVKNSVIFRKNIMKIVSTISAIVYFLFFMRIPD